MKSCCVAALMLLLVARAFALDGEPGMRNPSTLIQADGRFDVYATGNGLPAFASDDGWTARTSKGQELLVSARRQRHQADRSQGG